MLVIDLGYICDKVLDTFIGLTHVHSREKKICWVIRRTTGTATATPIQLALAETRQSLSSILSKLYSFSQVAILDFNLLVKLFKDKQLYDVYCDQHLGAGHSTGWSKNLFSMFFAFMLTIQFG